MIRFCPNCGFNLESIEKPVEPQEDIISEYVTGPKDQSGIPIAEPKVSSYRERFKIKQLHPSDVKTNEKIMDELPKQDSELDTFGYKGEKLFFGDGLQQEF